jgi:hypothetical protein
MKVSFGLSTPYNNHVVANRRPILSQRFRMMEEELPWSHSRKAMSE